MLKKIDGGVTAAKGFKAAGCAAGIKKNGKADMALIVSDASCAAAGTFTSNLVKAAPVLYDRQIVEEEKTARAVVVNAGVANACTGRQGFEICEKTAEAVSEILGDVSPREVLVASTGVIGAQIPLDKIVAGTKVLAGQASYDREAAHAAACAIMTTDTRSKEAAFEMTFSDGSTAVIGGMCRGSGMIHPNMCTMLSFITTDAAIDQALLKEALRADIKTTYNMVSVDGDTSTNDTCLILANGLAGNPLIATEGEDYETFKAGLHAVNESLAKMMAADGEGATAMFEVKVVNADTEENARILARSVVSSSLTKAAIYGHDANWGRILCALGYSGVSFDPERVDLSFESEAGFLKIVEDGVSTGYSEETATEILSESAITCVCDMKMGTASGTAWGCDLTHEYVSINGDYRS